MSKNVDKYFHRQMDKTAGIEHTHHRTKIVATVGPACDTYDKLLELVKCGVNVFRLNFSHGTHEVPWDGSIFFFDLFRDLIRGLADYDEIHFHRANGFIIFSKGLIFHATRKFLNLGNCLQYISNTVSPVSR